MRKFRQISTELWPLIYLKNSFILRHLLTTFSPNFVYGFISGRSGLGLKMCKISSNNCKTEL